MLTCQNELFEPLPAGVHYLNCSTISLNLKSAVEAGVQGIHLKSAPQHLTGDDFFTDAAETRQLFARLINCADSDRIALIPSVSYGTATVAKNLARKPGLRTGQEILVVHEEFPSDVLAWEEVCAEKGLSLRIVSPPVDAPDRGPSSRGRIWNERLLDAITDATCLVLVPPVHWTDGTRFDLTALRRRTREVGAWLIVDGSQSVGALPFDVADIRPDALLSVGYKYMLGPYGMGLSYWSETFDDGQPLEANWINRLGSNKFGELTNYQRTYRPKAWRYNVGEHSNFILLPMLNAALRQLLIWEPAAIQAYCETLIADVIPQLQTLGYSVEDADYRGNHLFGIRPPARADMDAIKLALADHGVSVSIRSGSIRISTHVWNTPDDVAALLDALASVPVAEPARV